jgi:hypothetical protein
MTSVRKIIMSSVPFNISLSGWLSRAIGFPPLGHLGKSRVLRSDLYGKEFFKSASPISFNSAYSTQPTALRYS